MPYDPSNTFDNRTIEKDWEPPAMLPPPRTIQAARNRSKQQITPDMKNRLAAINGGASFMDDIVANSVWGYANPTGSGLVPGAAFKGLDWGGKGKEPTAVNYNTLKPETKLYLLKMFGIKPANQ